MRICRFFALSFIFLLAACGPSTVEPVLTPSSDEEPALESVPLHGETDDEGVRLSATASSSDSSASEAAPADEAYPIPVPTPGLNDGGYPDAPPTLPPPSPYPVSGEQAWVLFPVGTQCEDTGKYVDETTAVAALTAAGLTVYESEVVELFVCTACGCPTSAHYRVAIDAAQVANALTLGWAAEGE